MFNPTYYSFLLIFGLLFPIPSISISSKGTTGGKDEEIILLEDEGPPHEPVSGDYDLENPNFPKETALPELSDAECAELLKSKYEHIGRDMPEFIEKNNYSLETHKVRTEDGFILQVFRITGSPISPPKPGKVPIFLNHGLAGNGWSWLFLPGNGSLAFKAANEGFDVWIGNARGSEYSSEHEKYSTEQAEYWDFSFHELGYYDVPAVIDYILNATGKKDIYYAGHSLGTMQYLIALSERPEYNAKIRVGFLLATAGNIPNIRSMGLRSAISAHTPIEYLRRSTNGDKLDPKKLKAVTDVLTNVTCMSSNGCGVCDLLTIQLFGFNPNQNNIGDAKLFNAKYFSTTSTKVFSHLHQSMLSGKFKKYNYMDAVNYVKYKSTQPPSYQLGLISAPTVTYWGFSDEATVAEDVKKTFSRFTPGVLKENNRVAIKSFNHLDFLIAKDIEKYVYNRMIWIMKTEKYLNQTKYALDLLND